MSLPLESAWLEMVSRGWGGEYGLSSQKSAIGLSSEEECVVAGGTWEALSIADIQQKLAELQLPGAKCADDFSSVPWSLFGGSEGCLRQRHTMRMDAARDMYLGCPDGFEARVDTTELGDLYVNYMCCPPSPTCSGPLALHYTYFCQGASSYHTDLTETCLAVLKFQGELQYIAKACSEQLSYICQDAPTLSVPTIEMDVAGDMKECFDESDLESNSFVDTLQQDVQGHTCSYYAKMKTSHPQVCDSSAAKTMCPVKEKETFLRICRYIQIVEYIDICRWLKLMRLMATFPVGWALSYLLYPDSLISIHELGDMQGQAAVLFPSRRRLCR